MRALGSIIVDAASGHSLLATNADARLPPASLTKMMTALVALDHAPLTFQVIATANSRSEPSIIGLDPGDVLTLEEALYGLLLPSGNDAALAIAESVGGGSIAQFVTWMNERAAAMGLLNTHFVNPHGLDAPGHYSSPRDMAQIARAVMNEPTLARIVSTPRYTAPGPPPYLFLNSNPLLGAYPGLDGVKTGFTDAAGRTYAASATRDGTRLIAVLFNSPDIAAEGRRLLDLGFSRTQPAGLEVARPGFARVQVGPPADQRWVRLAGWEGPFLRAFTRLDRDQVRISVSVNGHRLLEWSG